ncbi:bikaverin cluster-transcription factor [Fusarium subglutinans]|uniref:Bikaverin cluster-transcription factor n=1 Tax=Gibberella subglutinans TaxID=42677 RepID=A0A8H5L6A6_GIBSU|nr:bikaverin cluster-transcription factor [Fusarium subglutinans]KAF5585011.1 bikaverin cluster-transcription factor [Fusarium subglutinans]
MAFSISENSPPRVPTTSFTAETARISSTSDSPIVTPSTPSDPLPLRSCTFCRQRKVKCDRQKPCSNCLRANNDCSYPAGRGRAAKRYTRTLDTRLVDRLHKLENVIKQLTTEVDATDNAIRSGSGADRDDIEPSTGGGGDYPSGLDNAAPHASIDQQLGRLMIDDSKSYYVSNILWANLGNEIEELRDMLHDPLSEDEIDNGIDASGPMPEVASPLGTSASVLGYRSLCHSLLNYHPPMHVSVTLLNIFIENVLPLVHIFHMPTTEQWFWDSIVSLDTLDRNAEALLFAIYYSSVISMDDSQCSEVLGESRSTSLNKFRFAVEQAMARANLLNTQSLVLLQAAVLFLSGLRNEDDSRTTWSLTSLVFHIAQAMGLHRDGTTFGFKPFDTELRRRLWWHICLLDMRSSEFHGYEPIVREDMFDTKLPLNINDSDLTPHMTEVPVEHEGCTQMTFCLIRCEVMKAGWKVGYASPTPSSTASAARGDDELIVQELKRRLEERYLRHCDESVPFMLFTSKVARLIVARTGLIVDFPRKQKEAEASTNIRDRLSSISMEVLELSSFIMTNSSISKWTWHSKAHIQWHAVIFVLSEICSRPASTECDRAWEFINTVHNRWNMNERGKRGNLWRPIQRLMVKARYVREMQQLDPGFYLAGRMAMPDATPIQTGSVGLQKETSSSSDMTDIASPNGYMDWMLGDLGIDLYGGIANGPSWG